MRDVTECYSHYTFYRPVLLRSPGMFEELSTGQVMGCRVPASQTVLELELEGELRLGVEKAAARTNEKYIFVRACSPRKSIAKRNVAHFE